MLPDWVEAYRSKGTTVKQRGDSYYLYLATSKRVPGKRHPVSQQTYLGRITPEGVVRDRVSIKVSSTEARRLGEVREGVPPECADIVALNVRGDWLLTKADKKLVRRLEGLGIVEDGKVVA